jgi:hypothetical protein
MAKKKPEADETETAEISPLEYVVREKKHWVDYLKSQGLTDAQIDEPHMYSEILAVLDKQIADLS